MQIYIYLWQFARYEGEIGEIVVQMHLYRWFVADPLGISVFKHLFHSDVGAEVTLHKQG
ncbi:hypothetical protein GCM10010913_17480 [Paenibacillus aceti]|uniref:Transposase InsH N-terminal domain-containing protein n=1 Tax=Paenibacillus aceti TaxID=1820010 RepID=A0ABQ1VUW5_9BACL|nr:hypothetical protein GCM10010913_17480 [Paenibacillus aceti]